MARVKKFRSDVAEVLKTAEINLAVKAEQDIVTIPGFEAASVSFSRSVSGVIFTDSQGRQVLVRLGREGEEQWKYLTGGR